MTNEPANSSQSPHELALQALIMDPDFERLEDLLAEFNLFDVLGIQRRELQHSAFLAWLLNPRGSHGLRDYFLRHFLLRAAAEGQDRGIGDFTPVDVDGWKLDATDIEVATERDNIDILLVNETDGFVCLVENKIDAEEGKGQLTRYFDAVKNKYTGLIAPVYLTPDGRQPDNEDDGRHWTPLGYKAIKEIIVRTLDTRGSTMSPGAYSFLQQYVRTLERFVLSTTDNTEALALRIYNRHREAIEVIEGAKGNRNLTEQSMSWEILELALEEYTSDLELEYRSSTHRRLASRSLNDISELHPETGRMVTFELWYKGDMTLYAYVQPGPQEIRMRLRALAVSAGAPFHSAKKFGAKWGRIYRKPILTKQDYNPFDPEKAKPKLRQAITEFYTNDYWPIVNAIRQEFGLPLVPLTD